ncbi:MAG: hypothetical protein WDZ90_01985 [Candidatus Paceibacterota bacterium]
MNPTFEAYFTAEWDDSSSWYVLQGTGVWGNMLFFAYPEHVINEIQREISIAHPLIPEDAIGIHVEFQGGPFA